MKKQINPSTIIINKQARFHYELLQSYSAGLVLYGWEVKSIRQSKVQINEAYIIKKDDELWLFNALITPLITASTHTKTDPSRKRKLLLNRKEINEISKQIEQQGLSCVPTKLFWKNNTIKCEVRISRGKKLHDKRHSEKDRDWKITQNRLLKNRA